VTAPLDRDGIRAIIPHREPFLLVDEVTELEPGVRAVGRYLVKPDDWYLAGHFPGNPLVPGVLIAEALAQVSGLAGTTPDVSESGKLAHVDVRFDHPVAPPADIILKSRLTRHMPKLQYYEVSAEVNGKVVARGSLTLSRG